MSEDTTPTDNGKMGDLSREFEKEMMGEIFNPNRPSEPDEPHPDHADTLGFETARADRESLRFLEKPEPDDIEGTQSWGEQVRAVLDQTAMSDLGNAYRLLNIEGANLRYVHDAEHWIVRNEETGHWSIDADGAQARQRWHDVASMMRIHASSLAAVADDDSSKAYALAMQKFALKAQSKACIDAAVNVAATLGPLRIPQEELDADPLSFSVRNGVLNLVNRELSRKDAEGYNTMTAGVEFLPNATCPEWEKHIRAISVREDGSHDPDFAAYLQRWAGYNLTGLVSEQKFAFGFGSGGNGKNVYIETQIKVMGNYATAGSAKILTGESNEHETIIADLAGKRMVFIDEAPKGKVNDSRVKTLTGSGRLRARKMRQDSFEFPARFKLWIAGNNKPRITDTSEGMWRRLDLIPFEAKIPKDRIVRDYADILFAEEGSGILNWMLEGLASYMELGLAAPQRVLDATTEYRDEESSDTAQFTSDMFDVSVDASAHEWLPNPVIHGLYELWCEENGVKYVQSMRQLGPELKLAGFEPDSKTRRVQMQYGGDKVVRGWVCPPVAVSLPTNLMWARK